MQVSEAVRRVAPCLLRVEIDGPNTETHTRTRSTLGTGFLINRAGYAFTALHVIDAGRSKMAQPYGSERRFVVGFAQAATERIRGVALHSEVDVIAEDRAHDLALLKLRQNPFEDADKRLFTLPIDVAHLNPRRPADGVQIATSGYPFGPMLITTSGWLASSWAFSLDELVIPGPQEEAIQLALSDVYLADLKANPGNSGGPVYLLDGGVIGLCVATKLTPVRNEDGAPATVNGKNLLYNAGISVITPARYLTDMLRQGNLNWEESSES